MDERGLVDLIIARLPGLSFRDRIALCESCDREAGLIGRAREGIEQIIGHAVQKEWNMDGTRALAERDAATARMRGIQWVPWVSAAYPPLLREIYDPPPVLFFRGALPDPEKPLAAIVGTRRPSPEAAAQAYDIARDLGRRGISVISGLALGTDAIAGRGNLDGGVPGFAVLGSGVDQVCPAANRLLAKRILESGGALLSEYPPGTGARRWTFPARNRIVSGMARGVLIVEAPARSGALITARHARDENRDLWVASSGVRDSEQAALYDRSGTVTLALDGARVIDSAQDILAEWRWETGIADNANDGEREGRERSTECSVGMALAASMARSLDIDL